MANKYCNMIIFKDPDAVVSPRMLAAGAQVSANRGSMSPHDLVSEIYRAMHEAAPRARNAGALTATMHQALAILGKRTRDDA